ncbi:hypothetical protein DI270_020380 [Microbispora triticiradicis]|uniref:Secreted protein n=1 Tax=Microbispora triticiradicis TaxID=2200763 RepID=A0ABX9LGR4_9ACTN|nr:hypothetical protein DI270_020380 [Microbispora triticiradicis]
MVISFSTSTVTVSAMVLTTVTAVSRPKPSGSLRLNARPARPGAAKKASDVTSNNGSSPGAAWATA